MAYQVLVEGGAVTHIVVMNKMSDIIQVRHYLMRDPDAKMVPGPISRVAKTATHSGFLEWLASTSPEVSVSTLTRSWAI